MSEQLTEWCPACGAEIDYEAPHSSCPECGEVVRDCERDREAAAWQSDEAE